MSDLVDPSAIETIVGVKRHATDHYARAVSAEETVYILHSQACVDSHHDLRDCDFSIALDAGIDTLAWDGSEDRAVQVAITDDWELIPAPSTPTQQQGA